jgi:hypothetical protein
MLGLVQQELLSGTHNFHIGKLQPVLHTINMIFRRTNLIAPVKCSNKGFIPCKHSHIITYSFTLASLKNSGSSKTFQMKIAPNRTKNSPFYGSSNQNYITLLLLQAVQPNRGHNNFI